MIRLHDFTLVSILFHYVASNIVVNPGFELPVLSEAWSTNGGKIELVTNDSYQGHQSVRTLSRNSNFAGPSQQVRVKSGCRYTFKAYVKQLNSQSGKLFQTYKATLGISWRGNGSPSYITIAEYTYGQVSTGWFPLESHLQVPNGDIEKSWFYIEGPDKSVDFLVDEVFFEELWKMESNLLIDKTRKNKINFIITHDPNLDPKNITVEITHRKHIFGFGGFAHEGWMTDPSYKEYQDFFYYFFNWGTVQGFHWPSTANPDTDQYSNIKAAAIKLHNHGLKVRATSPFRSPHGTPPSWVQNMDAATLNRTVQNRIQTLTSYMGGDVDHWEVLENIVENHFYEQKMGDPNYLEKIYKMMKEADPSVELFISDNNVLMEGRETWINAAGKRYLDLVNKQWSTHISKNLAEGTSFVADGFQGDYDVTIYYKGKPIIRKDLHLADTDLVYELHIKGQGNEITLPTTSNPFGYSTHNYHTSNNGDHVIGSAEIQVSDPDLKCSSRISKVSAVGDDQSTSVSCDGNEILTGCSSVKQDFNGSDKYFRDGEYIREKNNKIYCKALNGAFSKRGVYAVARCCSTSHLKCNYRTTNPSPPSLDSQIGSTCTSNYLATGCSAHSFDYSSHGAYPTENGKGCLAVNGGPSFGIRSSAACCSAPGLTCTTVTSALSGPLEGDTTSVTCDVISGYVMTSCNFQGKDGKTAGVYITGNGKTEKCIAINGSFRPSGKEGVKAVAVCCKINKVMAVIG